MSSQLEKLKDELCSHDCTSDCRRNGCDCHCGDFHNDYQDFLDKAYSLALTELEERLPERTNGYTTETLGFNHCRFLTKRIIKKMKKEIK